MVNLQKRAIYFTTKVPLEKLNDRTVFITKISEDEVRNLVHFGKAQGNFYSFVFSLKERLLFNAKRVHRPGVKEYITPDAITAFAPKDNIIYAKIERDLDALMAGYGYENVPVTYYLLTVDI